MSSILGQGMASTKPRNIYVGVGVTAFPITCYVKKTAMGMQQYNLSFCKYVSSKTYVSFTI